MLHFIKHYFIPFQKGSIIAFPSAKFEPCPVGLVPSGSWRPQCHSLISYRKKCMLKISASEVAFFSILGAFALITIKKSFAESSSCSIPVVVFLCVCVDETLCFHWRHSFKRNDFALFSAFLVALIGWLICSGREQSFPCFSFCTQIQVVSKVHGQCWSHSSFCAFLYNYVVMVCVKIPVQTPHYEEENTLLWWSTNQLSSCLEDAREETKIQIIGVWCIGSWLVPAENFLYFSLWPWWLQRN